MNIRVRVLYGDQRQHGPVTWSAIVVIYLASLTAGDKLIPQPTSPVNTFATVNLN